MKWLSALSEKSVPEQAAEEAVASVLAAHSKAPDVAFLFASGYDHSLEEAAASLRERLKPKALLGCTASGVVGAGKELERKPSLSLLCGWLPGVEVTPFEIEQKDLPSPDAPPKAWRERIGPLDRNRTPSFVLITDPYSLDPEELIRGLDFAFPASVKIGGLASAASSPGENILFLNGKALRSGAVGLAFSGDVVLEPIVAQGCRPIGGSYAITKCDRNLLLELNDSDPLTVLQELFSSLPEEERALASSSLFLGVLNDPLKSDDAPKEFLVRNIIGLDPQRRLLAIGALLRVGRTVQFHVRDAAASTQDLERHLKEYRDAPRETTPQGALLFSCVGRGKNLFKTPNHDTALFSERLPGVALSGFFCNGEIGPVDGTTYLHGYTSSFGIFRPALTAAAPADPSSAKKKRREDS